MDFKKEQLTELISNHLTKRKGLHELLELILENLMGSERLKFLENL
ncbi:hypothetical protein SAMN05444380_104117 [Thermophagus xiamenensis]|uniref:Transposase, Mutator family n=1 Tax=Thermophagus xiamenensis TaxID=385682 RepID=A0A1I1WIN3_9BACT|nr:hypothetical protein SAMN05444380_104117 [Thermophagus xiamenensis]